MLNYTKILYIENKYKQKLLYKYSTSILKMISGIIYKINIKNYEIELKACKDYIHLVLFFLERNTISQYKVLTDIIAIDYPSKKYRFKVIYNLLSLNYNSRLFVTIKTNEIKPILSVHRIYKGASWLEREVWDLFGIFFKDNSDLRRILTDYGFEGHPLRKDFPLTGFLEVFYDDKEKRVVYEPIEITQEYRNFNFINPWLKK